jgi:hypothetical protein
VTTDQHGNALTGSSHAAAAYDAALDDLLAYRPLVLDHLETFASDHIDMPMGQVMRAYLQLTSTDTRDLGGAQQCAAALATLPLNERERLHAGVIDQWLNGNWYAASAGLDDLLLRWPTDMLALMIGHQLDFFLGDADNLRDRIGRSLGAFDTAHPHHGFALGMQAFGLEEAGHHQAAEAAGLAALDAHPDDVWATHAVTHSYEMRGMNDQGLHFLNGTQATWGQGNLFSVHVWWHLTLFLLEQQRIDEIFDVYDRQVHHPDSSGVPLEMLDASALLWRLYLDGTDTAGRFGLLADAWAGSDSDRPWYVFNDVHAVMALAGAGRMADARRYIAKLEGDVAAGPADRSVSNRWATATAGLPAAQAMLAFAEGRHADVVQLLLPVRRVLHRFGGSHAQRDAMHRTLIESALRDGQLDLATALVHERLAVRPNGQFALARLARTNA